MTVFLGLLGPSFGSPEPLALGFADREHPTGRRIRRLMDDTIFRAAQIRISAIVVLVLVLVLLAAVGCPPCLLAL